MVTNQVLKSLVTLVIGPNETVVILPASLKWVELVSVHKGVQRRMDVWILPVGNWSILLRSLLRAMNRQLQKQSLHCASFHDLWASGQLYKRYSCSDLADKETEAQGGRWMWLKLRTQRQNHQVLAPGPMLIVCTWRIKFFLSLIHKMMTIVPPSQAFHED